MSCDKLNSILKACKDDVGIGGIRRAFVFDMEDIDQEVLADATMTVTTLTLTDNAVEFNFKRNTAQHTTTPEIDLVAGSTFYNHVISLRFGRRKASKSVALQLLAQGQRDLGVVYEDANGDYWYVREAQMSGGEETTGQAKADNSAYEVELTAEMTTRAFGIAKADAEALLSQVS